MAADVSVPGGTDASWDPLAHQAPRELWRRHLRPFGDLGLAVASQPGLPLTGVGLAVLAIAAAMAVFGMPPIDVHGPVHRFGVMDPLCGMTRGTVAVMRGSLRDAWRYNPGSLLVLPAAAVLLARGLVGRSTGRWLVMRWRLSPAGWALAAVAVGLLWANQQAHAALLLR